MNKRIPYIPLHAAASGLDALSPLVALAIFAALTGTAAELPLTTNDAGDTVFGSAALQLTLDRATGGVRQLTSGGETLLVADTTASPLSAIDTEKPVDKTLAALPSRTLEIARVSDDTICVRRQAKGWRLEDCVQLFPKQKAVRHSCSFTWLGTNRFVFTGFRMAHGLFPCADGQGLFLFPWAWPPERHRCAAMRAGTDHWAMGGEGVTIAESGAGWSVIAAWDSLKPYSDRGASYVTTCTNGLLLHAHSGMKGYALPGRSQTNGDGWLMFRRGTAEEALANMHDWHRLVGHLPPADRPERVRFLTLYATHPNGRGMCEPGGFRHAQEYLPFVAALGINAIWMRPVEHKSCYVPDELYELQDNVGTPEDHLAYVRDAHARGVEVWRDAVMHGGRSDNRRSREHPEWICQKQDGTQQDTYWAYDFFWPTWVKYFADYVEWTTRKYEIDGWRMDVPTGSRFPNWNPEIPYARASYAYGQGGPAQMRAIRAAARRANPNAVTLAEANESTCSVTCDTIHDQHLCHGYFHWFNDRPADEVVRILSRWLDDQRKAFVPGSVWMRYPESHDAYPCDRVWGRAGANALLALCAWMEGFPLVMNESEDGAFETYRRILWTRRTLRELNDGAPDYLSVPAPSGVFACRRDNGETASVFYVNFNGYRVRMDGFELPPFGFAIRREKGPSVEACLKGVLDAAYAPNRSQGPRDVVAELRDATNGLITAGVRIVRDKSAAGVRFRVADFGGRRPQDVKLVLRLPFVTRWFAHAAEGSFDSPYLVRHPNVDRYHRHGEWLDGAVVFDSRYHPLGFTRPHAAVGGADASTAWECFGFAPRATVRVWNRLAHEPCCAVSVGGETADAFDVTCQRIAAEAAFAPRDAGTGDKRLRPEMGGWMYETDTVRLRIRRTGAVVGLWKKAADGSWKQTLGSLGVRGRDPAAPRDRVRKAWGGRDRDAKEQAFAPFPKAWFTRAADGKLTLAFEAGEVRGIEQNSGGMPHRVRAFATYELDSGRSLDLTMGFTATGNFGKGDWSLDILATFPEDLAAVPDAFLKPEYLGWEPETVIRRGNAIRYVYHDPAGVDFSSPRNWRNGISLNLNF